MHQLPTPRLQGSDKDNFNNQSTKDHVNSSMQSTSMKSMLLELRCRCQMSDTGTYLRIGFVNSQNLEYGDMNDKCPKFGYGCEDVFYKNKEFLYKFYTFI